MNGKFLLLAYFLTLFGWHKCLVYVFKSNTELFIDDRILCFYSLINSKFCGNILFITLMADNLT